MPVVATDKGGGSFQLAPVGNHLGIAVRVIDLGTQRDSYQGKPKILRKIIISWELPQETATFDDDRGEEPFMVSKEYTLSLGAKANLRHDLESWRGQPFTAEELEGFALAKILGRPAMVNVSHETSATKRQYVKITAVTAVPKAMKASLDKALLKPKLPIIEYSIDDGNNEIFKGLPDFIKEKILASVEVTEAGKKPEAPKGGAAQPDDDEIPF